MWACWSYRWFHLIPTGIWLNQPIYSYHVTQASRNRVKSKGPNQGQDDLVLSWFFCLFLITYMLNYHFLAATRCPRKDTKIGDYIISAGTIVFPNLYSMTTGYSLSEWLVCLSQKLQILSFLIKFFGPWPLRQPHFNLITLNRLSNFSCRCQFS